MRTLPLIALAAALLVAGCTTQDDTGQLTGTPEAAQPEDFGNFEADIQEMDGVIEDIDNLDTSVEEIEDIQL